MMNKPRILAIDYGSKRVGIASTDASGEFALPRAVLPNDKHLLDKVTALIQEEDISQVILGEPKNFRMQANPINEKIAKFKSELEKRGVVVTYHPEIFTTVEARRIQGNTNMTDASAAALILKSYIENTPK